MSRCHCYFQSVNELTTFNCYWIFLEYSNLPPNFPFEGPTLSVRPAAEHPLLDDTSTVCGLADLTAFSIHASLPDIIQQVLSDFITRPLLKRLVHI